ncbi:hypothetical protein [Bacteroides sp.]|uniref:hypothetical protein n=1 Tax=Bacteroides sp. TaxID=29523 RepID=UPI0025870C36|nr:hypothetical protein [Bacteroides sp.]
MIRILKSSSIIQQFAFFLFKATKVAIYLESTETADIKTLKTLSILKTLCQIKRKPYL